MKISPLAIVVLAATAFTLTGCSAVNSFVEGFTESYNEGAGIIEGEGDQEDAFSIEVGDCVNDGVVEGEFTSVPTVDCAELHDSEAYKSIQIEEDEFPGDDGVAEIADAKCVDAFEDFVGVSYDNSLLTLSYYLPTAETWLTGDREILCLIQDADEDGNLVQATGSLAGAKR
jgi:hypothetical protein